MERFSIKWDSFNDDVKRSFSQLRNEKKFSDVILVSDDHHLVSAHKVVLSTCSIYFNEILKQDLTGSVFFCLEGVDLNDLNNLLDYIYQGELTLPQGHIERFLLMVKRFKLDGFHEDLNQVDKSMNQLDWKMSFPKHEFLKKTDPLSKQVEEGDEFLKESSDPLSKQVEEADEFAIKVDPPSKQVDEFAIKADPLSKQVEEEDEFFKEADPLSKQVEEADEFVIKVDPPSKQTDEFAIKADPLSKQVEEEDEFLKEADPLSKQVEEADEFAIEEDPHSKKVDEAEQFAIKADPLSKQIEEADEFDIEADPLSNQVEEADEGIENEYLNSESTYTSLGHITISRPSLVPNSNTCGIKLQSFKDVKEKIKDMYIKHPFEFECKICGKICSKISNIKEHIEIHIEGLRFPCRTCGSEYGSRSGRRVHERVFHKMKPKIKNSL